MLVTDRYRVTSREHTGEENLDDVARQAVLGGVNVVQLREKDLESAELIALGLHVRDAIAGRALLLVNGDLEAAHTLRASGVHLPGDGPPVTEAHAVIGDGVLVSRAVHGAADALAAEMEAADFVIAGTLFASGSKPGGATIGLDGLRAICSAMAIPVVAIGGITTANAAEAIRAGASGVAVIGAILDAPDPRAAARSLRDVIDAAWAAR